MKSVYANDIGKDLLLTNFVEVKKTEKKENARLLMRRNKNKGNILKIIENKELLYKVLKTGIISWAILLGVWILAAKLNDPDFLPSPSATISGLQELINNGMLVNDIKISMQRVLIGWVRGISFGIFIGLLIGQFKTIKSLVEPLINFFRFVPAIGFLTLFLMWFGVGEESKLALITYAVVFPVIINTIAGVDGIDQVKYQAARSLGANKIQLFYTVTIPGAVPGILTGIRLGLSGAIISIVGAEMLAANEGLGYLIYTSRLYYRTEWIFVGIFILGLIGLLADKLIRYLAYRFFKFYGVAKN